MGMGVVRHRRHPSLPPLSQTFHRDPQNPLRDPQTLSAILELWLVQNRPHATKGQTTTPRSAEKCGGVCGRMRRMIGTLVLLRHGESEWNAKNLFTGWVDVDLN